MLGRDLGFKLEFLGSRFHGWQYQENAPSVQAAMEEAWLSLTSEERRFKASSRTDAGVSSRGLVCQCKSNMKIPLDRLPIALNYHLPEAIVVTEAVELPKEFSLRHQSIGKHYIYRIFNRRLPSVFLADTTYHHPLQLNLTPISHLNRLLEGEHDFRAFMDQGSPTPSTIRRLDLIRCRKTENIIEIHVMGSGFLYHMVRIIAGTVLACASNKLSLEAIEEAFTKGDRTALGATLPAAGLCLEQVFFKEELFGADDQAAYEGKLRELSK
ncbi:MAG: tRNA pseudouridine(38-40) synthase TruA [Eubacteriales bacterium]|nr:tRNA pseudouridine(38-40) synthase TruA [Eubacteriales bacterium]